MLAVPFVIYWLILKDFFHNLDVCDNSIDTGYCLSDLECATIVNGSNIGPCETPATSCCKITLNYFNETYLVNPLFARKSQTETGIKMVLFNTNTHSRFKIQYGNKSISSDRQLKTVYYNPAVHNCEAPHKIMWPITASYSRQRKHSSGINQLYVATLEKLDGDEKSDRKILPGCSSEQSVPDDEKFILLLNPQETFRLRGFITTETRNMSNMNFTFDVKRLSAKTSVSTRSRRSAFHVMCKQDDDSACRKQKFGDINDDLEEYEHVEFSRAENQDVHQQKGNYYTKIKDIVQIHDYVLGSESMLKQLIKIKDVYEEPINDEQSEKASPKVFSMAKQLDSNVKNTWDLEGKESVGFSRPPLLKTFPVKVTSSFNEHDKVQPDHDMRKPVQVQPDHDMRKPVQVQADHDMRKPVQIEATHDMRQPVSLDESHDLRWPVLEEETHDMRNPGLVDRKSSIFENIHGSKIMDSITSVLRKDNKNLEFEDFSSYCKLNISFNVKYGSSFEDKINRKRNKVNDLWKEALTVCGQHSEYTEDATGSNTKGNWPWMVSLQENTSGKFSHKCSASLLNSRWAITVAHCVDMKPRSGFQLVIRNERENTVMALDEVIIHPKFNRRMLENDLALLRLETPVKFQSNIFPVCLPPSIADQKNGTPTVLGWELKYQQPYDDSRKIVPVMTNYECEILYSTSKNKEKIKDTFICVGKNEGNCDAESGSSLTMLNSEGKWSVIGLVSWGSMCSNPEQPGVYIRISSYSQWIKDSIDCYEILV